MSKTLLFLLLLNMSNFSVNGQIESREPLINLDVFVNGERFQIKDGDTLTVSNTQIIVKSSDYLTFDFGGLRFDYPKYFGFVFQEDYAFKNWTLDGNDFVIAYFQLAAEAELETFMEEMVNLYGKKNCDVVDHSLKIGELDLKGKRIIIQLVGQKLTYDMYKLESSDFTSYFISAISKF